MENMFTDVFVVQDIEKLHGGGWGNKNTRRNEKLQTVTIIFHLKHMSINSC
jgi:hypothetical protein